MFYISVKQTVSTLFFVLELNIIYKQEITYLPKLVLYDMFLENIYFFYWPVSNLKKKKKKCSLYDSGGKQSLWQDDSFPESQFFGTMITETQK